jgi:hypothetical protein
MKRSVLITCVVIAALSATAQAHDVITTPVTWDREISRIFYSRCVACHREGGTAFSLAEYKVAFPWRTSIKEEVLERRMPPWGAVKGFGDFRNDQALTPEQLELLTSWSQGGSPEGEEKDLAAQDKLDEMIKESAWLGDASKPARHYPAGAQQPDVMAVKGDFKLVKAFTLDGLLPMSVPAGSFQIIAELPDGRVEPLLWLDDYKEQFAHPFLLRTPLELPAGTVISGVPQGATILLLPEEKN